MRKILKSFLIMVIIFAFAAQSVLAAEFITLYGTADGSVDDIAILVLDQNADLNNIKGTDIKYVNQEKVNPDGTFALTLPLLTEEGYIFRSNMEFDIYSGGEKGTVYVDPVAGSDGNDGATADTAFASLDAAYRQLFRIDEIVLLSDTTYVEPIMHSGNLTIKGNTSSVKLNLPSEISLIGDLTLDNLVINGKSTIYANGYNFKVTELVSSTATSISTDAAATDRLTVYGGKKSAELTGDTNIILLGGKYFRVYGGGTGAVKGNTNVVFGGKANTGDGINDKDSATISPCYVYGGGNGAAVTGKTSVTLEGEAVAKFIAGAGNGTGGAAVDTNIYINGGKVMNVYGGSLNAALTNCDTHIIMTGGLAEALFGGSQSNSLTGNTYITLVGGDISRRVYAGCYNNWELSWSTTCYVSGTTNLTIYPDVLLVTTNGLASENQKDMGVYAGSRIGSNQSGEISTLIFLDNCYSAQKGEIGKQDTGLASMLYPFKSFEDYTITATAGGEVQGTQDGGTIKIIPDTGYIGAINGVEYKTEGTATFSGSSASVTFTAMPYNINSMTATKDESTVKANVDIMGSKTETEPTIFVAVFEADTNKLIDCDSDDATEIDNKAFELNCKFEDGKKYIVKAMIWNESLKPLTAYYALELK